MVYSLWTPSSIPILSRPFTQQNPLSQLTYLSHCPTSSSIESDLPPLFQTKKSHRAPRPHFKLQPSHPDPLSQLTYLTHGPISHLPSSEDNQNLSVESVPVDSLHLVSYVSGSSHLSQLTHSIWYRMCPARPTCPSVPFAQVSTSLANSITRAGPGKVCGLSRPLVQRYHLHCKD